MTSSGQREGNDVRWYVRPQVVLPIIAGMVVLTALLAPDQIAGRTGNSRLSTYSTEPQGARLFYELAQRLGWRVEQRKAPELIAERDVIHAELSPVVPLRMSEVHALLEHVRGGGALFLVLGGNSLAAESLHVTVGSSGTAAGPPRADSAACASRTVSFIPLWPDNRAYLSTIRWLGPPPAGIETFLTVGVSASASDRATTGAQQRTGRTRPAAVGFSYGRGRIVIAADPDVLRNDVIRSCEARTDVPTVRMLEYLRDGGDLPRDRIVFDEYHQGFGSQPGTLGAIGSYLGGTASGRLLFQAVGAGLVLLLAAAPRTVPPRPTARAERRSPLEHVDALARAYAHVGATRTATLRLLRGVRRRVEHRAPRGHDRGSDDAFLDRANASDITLAPDIALVRRALDASVPRREFVALGSALRRIELSLTRI